MNLNSELKCIASLSYSLPIAAKDDVDDESETDEADDDRDEMGRLRELGAASPLLADELG